MSDWDKTIENSFTAGELPQAKIIKPTQKEAFGDGKVIVYRRHRITGKDKLIHLSQETLTMLSNKVVGSHVMAIDELVKYALVQLEKHNKDLEVI